MSRRLQWFRVTDENRMKAHGIEVVKKLSDSPKKEIRYNERRFKNFSRTERELQALAMAAIADPKEITRMVRIACPCGHVKHQPMKVCVVENRKFRCSRCGRVVTA